MRLRILLAILGTTALTVLVLAIPLGRLIFSSVQDQTNLRLTALAVKAAGDVPRDFASDNRQVTVPDVGSARFGLYDGSGRKVSGTGPDVGDMVVQRALIDDVAYFEHDDQLFTAIPIYERERVVGALRVSEPDTVDESQVRASVFAVVLASLAALIVGALVAIVLARRLSRPIGLLRGAAQQIGSGDSDLVVPRLTIPELDDVGSALTVTNRRVHDLLARERAFSSDASHQLRTPLTGIRANLETELAYPREDARVVLRETLDDVSRLERTVTELLALARSERTTDELDVDRVLADVRDAWTDRYSRGGRRLLISQPPRLPRVEGNLLALRHALDVLLDNSLVHGAGTTVVTCTIRPDAVSVSVADGGPGFSPQALTAGGLGLPLAARLVSEMPGEVAFDTDHPDPVTTIVLNRSDTRPPYSAGSTSNR